MGEPMPEVRRQHVYFGNYTEEHIERWLNSLPGRLVSVYFLGSIGLRAVTVSESDENPS